MDSMNDRGAAGAEGTSREQAAVCRILAAVRALDRADADEAERIVDHLALDFCAHDPHRSAEVAAVIRKGLFIGGMPISLGAADAVHAVMADAWDLGGSALTSVVGTGGLLLLGLQEGWLPEIERIQLDALLEMAGPRARQEADGLLRRIYRYELGE